MASEQEALLAMHEHIFDILYKKYQEDSSFFFTLEDNETALENGRYFGETYAFDRKTGKKTSNTYIQLSFWIPSDISFYIDTVANKFWVTLYTSSFEEKEKAFLSVFANALNGENLKIYPKSVEKHYDSFEDFLKTDKQIIDNLIRQELEKNKKFRIGFIWEGYFKENLERVLNARKRVANWKKEGNIKIKSLQLSNIGRFGEETKIDFSKQVTCIIGENGSGKSTILRALVLSLCGVHNSDKFKTVARSLIRIPGENRMVRKGAIEVNYELNNRENLFTQKTKYETRIFPDYQIESEGDFANMTDWYHFKTLTIGFPQVQGSTMTQIGEQLDTKKGNLKDILPLILSEPDNRFEMLSIWIMDLFAAGNNEIVNGVPNPKQHQIIYKMFEIISAVTENTVEFMGVFYEGFGSGKSVWIKTEDSPNGIPLSLISQGYNNVFGWIGFLIKRLVETNLTLEDFTQAHAIVLIDEIDTYLHPKWQRTILATLAKSFPNVQFIVTTHSPLVITHLDNQIDSKIYQLKNNGIEEILAAGRDISSALWEYFGVERRSMLYQTQINDLFKEFEEEEIDEQVIESKLKNLKQLLGEKDPDVSSAERIFEGIKDF